MGRRLYGNWHYVVVYRVSGVRIQTSRLGFRDGVQGVELRIYEGLRFWVCIRCRILRSKVYRSRIAAEGFGEYATW